MPSKFLRVYKTCNPPQLQLENTWRQREREKSNNKETQNIFQKEKTNKKVIILKNTESYNLNVNRVGGRDRKAIHFCELLTAVRLKSSGHREGGCENHTDRREFC